MASDLIPYTCVYDDCTIPYRMYATSDELLAHMNDQHTCDYWVCSICYMEHIPSYSFRTADEWGHHMETLHKQELPSNQLPLLSETSKRTGLQDVLCPLCSETNDDHELNFEHIATHVHSFSIFALTWNVEEEATDIPSAYNAQQGTQDWDLGNSRGSDDDMAQQQGSNELHPKESADLAPLDKQSPIRLIVGIDFGTSHSGVAYCFPDSRDKKLEVISEWPGMSQNFSLGRELTVCQAPRLKCSKSRQLSGTTKMTQRSSNGELH